MARERNEIYLENSYDIFKVIDFIEEKPFHEYTLEIYSLRQFLKGSTSVGLVHGYDFLFNGVRFYQYITSYPSVLEKDFIDYMFAKSFKNDLAIRR